MSSTVQASTKKEYDIFFKGLIVDNFLTRVSEMLEVLMGEYVQEHTSREGLPAQVSAGMKWACEGRHPIGGNTHTET